MPTLQSCAKDVHEIFEKERYIRRAFTHQWKECWNDPYSCRTMLALFVCQQLASPEDH
ncbi:unnamed protein product [Amoebophrya sp. A25]|nr:unnamed protein product [Amoebophrya sp. A25]|eukprot:GSA25T00027842001.1